MLCRCTSIRHKSSGITIETPLLVPSFSSKGFAFKGGKSEVATIVNTAAEVITGVFLISAFDIAKKHLPSPRDLPMKPELIILDSGGYEVSEESDLSEVILPEPKSVKWSLPELKSVLDAWPDEMPAIFVSYDHPEERKPLSDQIAAARELFRTRRSQLHCFLIKQEKSGQSLKEAFTSAVAQADEFGSFDVVGLTEKGLGSSPLQRMIRITKLRRALDEANLKNIPLHVFGSLDPISVSLYFIAGAEIFDGLTWLRYVFVKDDKTFKDQCVYIHGYATFEYGVHMKDTHQKLRVMTDNYYYLLDLTERLKHFQSNEDFSKLPHPEFMKEASEKLQRELNKT